MLGDSVVWGEYVLPDGTLSHFLNQRSGRARPVHQLRRQRPVPAGAGRAGRRLRPGAAPPESDRALQRALDDQPEGRPEHDEGRAVQPFPAGAAVLRRAFPATGPTPTSGSAPSSSATSASRLGRASAERLLRPEEHPEWTLDDDGSDPPHYPNAWKNPLAQITLTVPAAPPNDPQRGPASPRHKPWTEAPGHDSIGWSSTPRSSGAPSSASLATLRQRGNDVLVLLGPFNEHMWPRRTAPPTGQLRDGIAAWLTAKPDRHASSPRPLPSALYADASHPLTAGYELLAQRICHSEHLPKWCTETVTPKRSVRGSAAAARPVGWDWHGWGAAVKQVEELNDHFQKKERPHCMTPPVNTLGNPIATQPQR